MRGNSHPNSSPHIGRETFNQVGKASGTRREVSQERDQLPCARAIRVFQKVLEDADLLSKPFQLDCDALLAAHVVHEVTAPISATFGGVVTS
jgi:hypothetical protein